MQWHILANIAIVLILILIVINRTTNQKRENLSACPAGCVATNPDPCPYGYKLNPTTNQCAPQPNIPK
jgi:hypothetical protein